MTALFFGCWNEPGHCMFAPGRLSAWGHPMERPNAAYLDSGYAPRRDRYTGALCWIDQGGGVDGWRRLASRSEELPQGQFLRHAAHGWTFISWWDRAQGDTRSNCNSTFLLHGEHTSAEMVAALAEHFPHVVANLKRAGVELQEVAP